MRYLLLTVPTPILLLLIVGGSALLGAVATYFVRTRIEQEAHEANNEVAGFMLAAVAVTYGVLLAFMVLVVWQAFQDAQVTVEREANTLVNIYRLGQELPEPYGAQIRAASIEYAQSVIELEWNSMQYGQEASPVREAIEKFWTIHRHLHDANVPLGSHEGQMFDSLVELGNERRIRLLDSRNDLPSLMWLLLIGGGMVTIGFTLFLRAPNWIPHLLMAALFSGLVAFVLFLIVELDDPFAGDVHVQPLAFQQALELFTRLGGK